jgi:DNA-directed RNA polymerase subunit RPC12/RpoP
MTRKRAKPRFHARCTKCGWQFQAEKLESGERCQRCECCDLRIETDIEDWIPEDWVSSETPGPAPMEKRFGFTAVLAGIASPQDMIASFDEIAAGRTVLSPNVPVAMLRRGAVSEPEARALLNFLAKYEKTPIDLEFGNLAQKAGHIKQEDIDAWNAAEAGLPPSPWPVMALESARMQVPAVLAVLEVQSQRGRGLKPDLEKALRRPPPSRSSRLLRQRLRQMVAAAYGVAGTVVGWYSRRLALLLLSLILVGGIGFGIYAGYRQYRTSLRFVRSPVHLLKCAGCGKTVAWEGTKAAVCPGCGKKDLFWVRRCGVCFRVQASESHFPIPPNAWEKCKVCGNARWTVPYRFVDEQTRK